MSSAAWPRTHRLRPLDDDEDEIDVRAAYLSRAAKEVPPNDPRYHQQALTLYFFMHKHLDVAFPKHKLDTANPKPLSGASRREIIAHQPRFRVKERVGIRDVTIGCYFFTRTKNNKSCCYWDEIDRIELFFEMKFKGCFFWCRIDTNVSGETYEIKTCMLGTTDDKIPVFEKLCRRFDGIMVMQKMIDAQADYE